MLPPAQRRSRVTKSPKVGGLPSALPVSSGSTRTFQPAACRRVASTWSWERMRDPSGRGSRRQSSRKGAMRISALWPQ